MQEFFKTETIQERVLLIGVRTGEADDTDGSLDELEELVKTAGALTVGRVIQNREAVHPTTYIGKGKIDEVRALAAETDASGVVCDDELSPVQLRELEDELQMKVMDRTLVILDIFAGRATTSEGKIQVELAQLKYRLTRLTGLGRSLSRLGGGIGTRGPAAHPRPDRPAEPGVKGSEAAPGGDPDEAGEAVRAGGGHRGLYQRRQIHPA